ncbi:hypothetical protein ACS127_17735 [Amphibacillus sp. Q70]|uniref:hypothetical protein n=1 Tax=Amphibacillus sp. Q70 TaxID=3453416 RepID=UPI003F8556ED
MVKNQTKNEEEEKKKAELIQELNQKVAASLWVQFIGQLGEAIYLSQLAAIQPESRGDVKNLVGQWVQTVGQGLEAVGATTQGLTDEQKLLIEAQIQGIQGDALQTIGSALQVVGSQEVLLDDLLTDIEKYSR